VSHISCRLRRAKCNGKFRRNGEDLRDARERSTYFRENPQNISAGNRDAKQVGCTKYSSYENPTWRFSQCRTCSCPFSIIIWFHSQLKILRIIQLRFHHNEMMSQINVTNKYSSEKIFRWLNSNWYSFRNFLNCGICKTTKFKINISLFKVYIIDRFFYFESQNPEEYL